ncbi:Bifunctional riboflavin biosynthesis protein RIBA 1, chloroplastic [Porphyridium purpureum]|uniref:Bifunctional riboflavin biosynthesis protein RIBA 1, chloroplastic n=1 Tax=Porphyridium purpureum TaxID=35688 RepID=A0A5J4Z247_PORPP|nr:Bifunctional riboflavin biosynthesis protein RIBA 1, chloroplastic [Porphyridium purpureum]|eukprot:POR3066..scf208_2
MLLQTAGMAFQYLHYHSTLSGRNAAALSADRASASGGLGLCPARVRNVRAAAPLRSRRVMRVRPLGSNHDDSGMSSDSEADPSKILPEVPMARDASGKVPGWCFGKESVERALDELKNGRFVVVVDDADRENEGDLIIAADKVTPEAMAFMVRYTSGVICVSLEEQRCKELKLSPMVTDNEDPKQTAFMVTVDYKHGTTTGISAADRAKTIRAMADPSAQASDFHRPGHIFPLMYRSGGVLKRAGHTEAAVDFARIAGCAPVGVLSEIVNDRDGSMARMPDLIKFCEEHNLVMTSIADLVRYRRSKEKLVEAMTLKPAKMPTRYGEFDAYAFRSILDNQEHLALVQGGLFHEQEDPVLVRVHSECCTGDVFGSLRCDCGPQLDFAMKQIAARGNGVLVYLRGQEGRGIGLGHKMRAYALQDQGRDTVQANQDLGLPVDSREYGVGAQILNYLGVKKMKLMTNNPAKYTGLSGYGLSISERVQTQISANPQNLRYLRTKRDAMGHWLDGLGEDEKAASSEDVDSLSGSDSSSPIPDSHPASPPTGADTETSQQQTMT